MRAAVFRLSLTRRFALNALLAVVAVGASGFAVVSLRSQSETDLERLAEAESDVALDQLFGRVTGHPFLDPTSDAMRALVRSLVDSIGDASAGLCTSDGDILVAESGPLVHAMNRTMPRPFGSNLEEHGSTEEQLLPADPPIIAQACRGAREGQTARIRVPMPRDLLIVSARRVRNGVVAWLLMRPLTAVSARSKKVDTISFVVMAVASLLILVLGVDSMRVLRRGVSDLGEGLRRLEADLRAPIPEPRMAELAAIAQGLRSMAVHLDETRERETELERRLAHDQRLAELGRVVAGVAHEIRNPLAGLKLKLDGLARRKLDDRSNNDVGTCLQEIARLDRVVASLLVVVRKRPTQTAPVDLAALCDERVEHLRGHAAMRQVSIVRRGEGSAKASHEDLARIIDNVVRNAVEASPPDSEVEVMVAPGTIEVRDAGAGLPANQASRLFEPFFTLKPEGTGLGLFLSRSLAQAQGGQIEYLRCDAKTCFKVTLPRCNKQPDEREAGIQQ
jgi:signal transduction histidine kinase